MVEQMYVTMNRMERAFVADQSLPGKWRKILSIIEVKECDGLKDLFSSHLAFVVFPCHHLPPISVNPSSCCRKMRTEVLGNVVNNDFKDFYLGHIVGRSGNGFNICYYESYAGDNATVWQIANPWPITMPFTTNLGIVILLVRLFYVFLNFAGQPRFLAELLAGMVLGSGMYGPHQLYSLHLRPLEELSMITTMANWGILFYAFMAALEMDFAKLTRVDKKTLSCTVAGIVVPLGSGAGLHFLFTAHQKLEDESVLAPWFWAIALTVTSFSDLARVLSDLKLLYTDLGRTALDSAFLSDLVSWTLFALTLTCLNARTDVLLYLPPIAFALFCWFVFRPFLARALTSFLSEGGYYSDSHIYTILSGMLVFGFIADICGCHSIVGVFMFGLILPKEGDLAQRVSDKLERIMISIFLPIFFIVMGMRANICYVNNVKMILVAAVIILAALPKIVSILIISMCYGMRFREGIALGTLMNTKGITALIIVSAARDNEVMGNTTFTLIVLALVGMMLLVKPIPYWACKSTRKSKYYKHRTLERTRPNSQLHVVVCAHASENLPGMINLLQLLKQKKQQPIYVFAANLVELTRRTTAMLILHDSPNSDIEKIPSHRETEVVKCIASSIRNYEKRAQALLVREMTVVSPYASMHKDIHNLASDNKASLVLLPFHKRLSEDEFKETDNHSIRLVNQNFLATAPCSVGIFIDRGFSSVVRQIDSDRGERQVRAIVLFSGGNDNREALAYACRMVGANDVSLTVVLFVPGNEAQTMTGGGRKCKSDQQLIDDEYINEFRFRMMYHESVTSVERVVNTGYEILTCIGEEFSDYDLYVLGKGRGVIPPFTLGLSEWTECEELGALGDALSTSEFINHASILVIQQQID